MMSLVKVRSNSKFWPSCSVFIYAVSVVLAFLVCSYSQQSISLKSQIATAMDVEGSADLAVDELLEAITFSLYKGATDRVKQHRLLVQKADDKKSQARMYATALFLIAISWLIVQYLRARTKMDLYIFWRHVLLISIVCLTVGLIAPMMQMTAYKDLPVLGDVIFKYEAKSIFSTVTGLIVHGSFVIAVVIGIFSILTPLAKMIVVGMSLFNVAPSLHKKAHHLIHLLGKWSMADVFVVAILISIFALDSQEFTKAETDIGLYFFTAYCVLSLLVTHAVLKEPEIKSEQT